jgi:predicted metal-dependent phosphoesterase TrpH
VTDVAASRWIDFHTHSTASDGSCAPALVVELAHRAGLSAIALTDHDTLGGVAAAQAAGETLGVRVVAGVELSALADEREMHLLGLHLQDLATIEATLATFRATRVARAEQIVAKLNSLGVLITAADVMREAGDGAVGRPHIARVMIGAGWVRDSREAFDRFLGSGKVAYVPKHRLLLAEAIELVHASGGLAVYAHPGPEGRRDRIEPLVSLGLDGIEVRHPSHSSEDVARLGALCDFFSLVPSGGSDWHGALEGSRVLGSQSVPYAWLERQEARVLERRDRASAA